MNTLSSTEFESLRSALRDWRMRLERRHSFSEVVMAQVVIEHSRIAIGGLTAIEQRRGPLRSNG